MPEVETKKTCFVVMGFGEKTDYKTSRVLDLNKSYRYIIKKAVEDAGLQCIRADEIPHAGTIDVPMYELLLDADLVIADLSTSNLNAAYELGVRHALKPATTIVIAESQFDAPFDVNHILIRKYRHDGRSLDIEVVEAFRASLADAIRDVMANGRVDSPVYTFLPLRPPGRRMAQQMADQLAAAAAAPVAAAAEPPPAQSLATLMDLVRGCKTDGNWANARTLLLSARMIAPHDVGVTQQLALATYKSQQPDALTALTAARDILQTLNPQARNDAETLGLWGAAHKRLFELTQDRSALDTAVQAHEKGFWLLGDHYNGINLAYLLDTRALLQTDRIEALTDAALARRTRRLVRQACDAALATLNDLPENGAVRYWLLASRAEAALGLGDEAQMASSLAEAAPYATEGFMLQTTTEQLRKLRGLLAASPLHSPPA